MIKSLSFILGIFVLSGCTNSTHLNFTENKNISAIFWNSSETCTLVIGNPDHPYSSDLSIQLKVDGKLIFNSNDKSVDKFVKYLKHDKTRKVESWNEYYMHPPARQLQTKTTWGENAYKVELHQSERQSTNIIIQNNKVLSIRIDDFNHKPDKKIIEIKVGDSQWKKFRLTRENCIQLFGKPKEEDKYFIE